MRDDDGFDFDVYVDEGRVCLTADTTLEHEMSPLLFTPDRARDLARQLVDAADEIEDAQLRPSRRNHLFTVYGEHRATSDFTTTVKARSFAEARRKAVEAFDLMKPDDFVHPENDFLQLEHVVLRVELQGRR